MTNIKWSRIVAAALVPAIPILIILSFYYLLTSNPQFTQVWWIPNPAIAGVVVTWVVPSIFVFGWVFILILFVTRTADTLDAVASTSRIISLRLRLFYGFDALCLGFLFAFPMVTPVVAILAFGSLGWRITTINKDWDAGTKVGGGTYVVMILFAIPAIICAIIYLPAMFALAQQLWAFWLKNVLYLYNIAMSLATAATVGSLIYFVRTGASEYEQAQQGVVLASGEQQPSLTGIRVFQVIFFAFLVFLYVEQLEILTIFFWAGLGITIFIAAVNLFRKSNVGGVPFDRTSFVGYILSGAFYVVELGWKTDTNLKSIMFVVAALVFLGIFAWKFFTVEESD